MAGHMSDPDPTQIQIPIFATSEIETNRESRTFGIQELTSPDTSHNDFTPATAMGFGLDLQFFNEYPDLNDVMDWKCCYPFGEDDHAPEVSQEPNGFDDEDHEEKFVEPEVDTLFAQPESDDLSAFSYNFDYGAIAEQPWDKAYEPQLTSARELNLVTQGIFHPADSLTCAVGDFSDLLGIPENAGYDLNGHFPGDFELQDNLTGMNFLDDLKLIGRDSQPAIKPDDGYSIPDFPHSTDNITIQDCRTRRVAENTISSANSVALAKNSELDLRNENPVVLIRSRRLPEGNLGDPNQKQPDVPRIRIHRNKCYIENSAYTPLDEAPKTWDIFEYTKDGELDPSRLFSAEEINRFLLTHPLHQGYRNLKESPLKIRVHKTPASSAKRFPNGLFCRFKACPMRTINQGQLLVIADELSIEHPDHDLYLNAAYFHLWCMERYCDFPAICASLDVTTKGRDSRKEPGRKNRFVLGDEEERVVEDFVVCSTNGRRGAWVARCPDQQTSGFCPHYDPQSLTYKGTLCHQLTLTKLHYGGQGRINLRKDREEKAGYQGANIFRHLGDLGKEAELREFSRTHRNQNQLKEHPKTERCYRNDDDIRQKQQLGHYEPSERQEHRLPASVSPHLVHGTKRMREERDDSQNLERDMVHVHKKQRHLGFKMPVWNLNQFHKPGLDTRAGAEDTVDLPSISPRIVLTSQSQRTPLQLQRNSRSPTQDGRSATMIGLRSSTLEDESEGEIELAILAAQRRRKELEMEVAKDREEECRLRKLKLQRTNEKKRAREEGHDEEYDTIRGKRYRVCPMYLGSP